MQARFYRLGWFLACVATACGGSSSDGPDSDAGSDGAASPSPHDAGAPDTGTLTEAGPPPFSTGLDGNTPLGQLPDDKFQRVCADLNDHIQEQFNPTDLKPVLCNLTGVVAVMEGTDLGSGGIPNITELRETCATARDACLNGSADAAADSVGFDGFEVDCDQPDPSCDVTVDELETCTNDLTALRASLDQRVPECEALTLLSLLQLATEFQDPEAQVPRSCQRLNRCETDASGN
jgi:hypothetical protein